MAGQQQTAPEQQILSCSLECNRYLQLYGLLDLFSSLFIPQSHGQQLWEAQGGHQDIGNKADLISYVKQYIPNREHKTNGQATPVPG